MDGEGLRDPPGVAVVPDALTRPRGMAETDFTVGEGAVDVLLAMRGIFVGVSLGRDEDVTVLSLE